MALTKRIYWKLHDYARYIFDLIWIQAFLKKIIPLHKHIKALKIFFYLFFQRKDVTKIKHTQTKQNHTKENQQNTHKQINKLH